MLSPETELKQPGGQGITPSVGNGVPPAPGVRHRVSLENTQQRTQPQGWRCPHSGECTPKMGGTQKQQKG
jgi:hypothetical protein